MRIAVNTRLLLTGKLEGIGWFSYETLKRITREHPEHEFIFIFDRKYSDEFIFSSNIIPVIANPPARHPVLWYLFFEWGIPRVLKKYKSALFLSPDGWLCLRTRVPSLPVIHDLNFFHNPQWVDPLPRYYFNYFFPKYIRKAARIATVSEYSKRDISSRFNIPESNIDVVYDGANENFHPVSDAEKKRVRNEYSAGAPYFLFVGLVHPRKNLARIIDAYGLFKASTGLNTKLLIVGSTHYQTQEVNDSYNRSVYKDDIRFLGRKQPSELNALLASSEALVYASLFEGFGIPVLEAMKCQTAVITSNVTSMPEAGGEAVRYVDPYSPASIAEAMKQISKDIPYRQNLIKLGNVQITKFSWDITANRLWDSIQSIILR